MLEFARRTHVLQWQLPTAKLACMHICTRSAFLIDMR